MKNIVFAILGMIAGIGIGIAFAADRCMPSEPELTSVDCGNDRVAVNSFNAHSGKRGIACVSMLRR
jgi:hypothetical protein